MTEKDFQIIASALRANRPAENWADAYIQWSGDVVAMAHELARTYCGSYQFDFHKFYNACGVVCGQKGRKNHD